MICLQQNMASAALGFDNSQRLHKSEWEVRPVRHVDGKRFVELHHYAKGGSNTGIAVDGLFRVGSDELMGVAWWLPPTKAAALATYPENWRGVLSLTRLALHPDVPQNGATFLLSRSRRLLDREVWPCLVTYADEWRGHTGAIYRADNWEYRGKTVPQPVYVLDGRMIARKMGRRSRTHKEMLDLGAVKIGSFAKHKFVRMN